MPRPSLPVMLPRLTFHAIKKSGLHTAVRILKDVDGIGHIELDEEDVVRHRLVKAIIKAYNKEQNKQE